MLVKILCDDNYNPDLTYQIDGEEIGNINADTCERCKHFDKCQGWAKIFNRCNQEVTI